MDYCYATIAQLHQAFRENKLTVRELVLQFISRIAEFDRGENGLNSVLELNPDALFIADALDRKLREGAIPEALFGIPVLLKDNINTADRLHTSAGSVALKGHYAASDAFIVHKLRKAGAVILGKANMTEFANFMTDGEMPDGYSSRGGQVVNPYNRQLTPSGSSSGSAVAVAAGLCTLAIGTETCGSIVSPAGQNGIVGIKPTLGLVGRSGILPISHSFDTAGPMARTVEDAALALEVISGFDPDDAATHAQTKNAFLCDYKKNGLQGLSIGVYHPQDPDESFVSPVRKRGFQEFCSALVTAGAVLTENIALDLSPNLWPHMRYEFKADLNYYLSESAPIKTLDEIIAYNAAHAQTALRYGQSTLLYTQKASGNRTEPEYLQAVLQREATIQKFDQIFLQSDIDVILCRTFNNVIAPYTGFPSIILPIGQREDMLPLDCYLMARRYREDMLLRAAWGIEQLLQLALKPNFS